MLDVRVNDQLDYRDGHEQADVAPVLVDRLAGGGMRVVVRYPRDVRVRARNRVFITVGSVMAWGVLGWQAAIRPRIPWWEFFASGWWPFGPAIVIIMTMLWWQAQRLYVFEASRIGLTLERHGLVPKWRRRRRWARDSIREIRIETNLLHRRPVALTILSRYGRETERLFDGLDERYLTIIADALREGLGLAASSEPAATQ